MSTYLVSRVNTLLLVLVVLMAGAIMAMLAAQAYGGALDPPGAPSSTMKTLGDVPGSWNRSLTASGADSCNTARFTCVFSGTAVLDNETGLVWQRDAASLAGIFVDANNYCLNLAIANRKGWRLPSTNELTSLVDPTGATVKLPAGHPFTGTDVIGSAPHWTSTEDPASSLNTINVIFSTGNTNPHPKDGTPPSILERVWCVRSGETP